MDIKKLKGDWALITGASSGIGKEFAMQLAQNGMNLVLVARRKDLLETLATLLRQKFSIQVKVCAIDLTIISNVKLLKQELTQSHITIRLLCNNAGSGKWGYFINTHLEDYQHIIHLNNTSLIAMCYEFYDHLQQFEDSAIINVSSPAAYQPIPYMAVYAASKAFVQSFSQALYGEWQNSGIVVQTLVPGPTETEFDNKAGAYTSAINKRDKPEKVVEFSLKGLKSKKPVIVVAKNTFVQRLFAGLFPASMVIRKVSKMFKPPAY